MLKGANDFVVARKIKNPYRVRGREANKKAIISDYLPWLVIAIAVLAILTIAILVMKGKGIILIDRIKDLFRGV